MPQRGHVSRSRILEGAAQILDSGVYGDLTVDALARVLHMSKSTLYKHFTSKDDLVVSLVDDLCSQVDQALEDRGPGGRGAPREALRDLIGIYAEHADRMPRAAILQASRLPPACRDRVDRVQTRLGKACRETLEKGINQGAFRQVDPALACASLLASARAVTEAAARGEVQGSRGEAVRRLIPLFEPGLGVS